MCVVFCTNMTFVLIMFIVCVSMGRAWSRLSCVQAHPSVHKIRSNSELYRCKICPLGSGLGPSIYLNVEVKFIWARIKQPMSLPKNLGMLGPTNFIVILNTSVSVVIECISCDLHFIVAHVCIYWRDSNGFGLYQRKCRFEFEE